MQEVEKFKSAMIARIRRSAKFARSTKKAKMRRN